ncbi:MAG: TetR/AcrR family transcriptional regulator [Sphingosinicella sp.]|uniref:TetR/AcrR family transcriptional regulator n=1 Tax=Sphingosinicella sp. TaxID=1917971 RepID=UPI004037D300
MNVESPKRPYRQSARARATEETGRRIVDAFVAQFRARWFDEIRLEDVAGAADVAVQTVLRRFGSKEGLLGAMQERMNEEIIQRRTVAPGDHAAAIEALIEDYEEIGELIMRMLAQEDKYPALRAFTDSGRAFHRDWIASAFAPALARLTEGARRRAVDALVVAGDIYVWRLIRKDMARPIAEYRALLEIMCAAALGVAREEMFDTVSGDDE